MLPGFVLALREGLEASLIVGILLSILKKLDHREQARSVWLGTICAAVLSVLIALGLTEVGAELEGKAEALFEGVTLLIAAGMLTWMIFWMQKQGRSMRGELETRVRQAISDPRRGLFTVAFVAVLREGIELALFLTAAAATTLQLWIGGGLGLALAIVLGWALFASTVKLDVRRFFQVTGAILLVFAAGLVARSIHEFVELGWLPALVNNVWSTYFLSEESALGQVTQSLLGYQSSPSLSEVIGYVGFLVIVSVLVWRVNRTPSRAPADAGRTAQNQTGQP